MYNLLLSGNYKVRLFLTLIMKLTYKTSKIGERQFSTPLLVMHIVMPLLVKSI